MDRRRVRLAIDFGYLPSAATFSTKPPAATASGRLSQCAFTGFACADSALDKSNCLGSIEHSFES